jgi:hypothetical protein
MFNMFILCDGFELCAGVRLRVRVQMRVGACVRGCAHGMGGCEAAWKWELLKTCCAVRFRACGARFTLGKGPLLGANFVRSLRFLEVHKL